MKPKVSIVMPVYNGEQYLSEALDSLLNQTYQNFELICVDDGSKDSSFTILNIYSSRDNRIKVIRQNNQFAGIARNNGLKAATGKYIMFLDSDDVFERNMLSTLVRCAERQDTDIIYFGFYHFSDDLKYRSMMGIPFHSRKVFSPVELHKSIFHIAQGMPWNKFYKLDFVNKTGILFQGLQSNNDLFFTKTIMVEAQKILFINKRFVNHRVSNANSLQGSYKLESGNFAISIYAIYEYLNRRGLYSEYKENFEEYVLENYMLVFDKCNSMNSFSIVCSIMNEYLKKMNMSNESYAIKNHPANRMWTMILDGNVEESLLNMCIYLRSEYVSKASIECRIGRKLLTLFKIKNY